MNKQTILITGSCGFIFSNFIRRVCWLINNKPEKYPYRIISLDKVPVNYNGIYINNDHKFYIADITDHHIIDTIFKYEHPNIVIHGAAESAVDLSINNPNLFVNNNVLGTQNIINSCLQHRADKLIYISTDEVYGHLISENEPAWTEDMPLNPRNPYSASKAAGELLVKAAAQTYGLKYNITRSCNNYGPRQTPDKLIPKVIKCILNNEKIPVYGQGLQIRDWIHTFDKAEAIIKIIKKGIDNEIYNISANQEYSNIEVIQEICNIMKKGHDLITFVEDRKGHDFRYSINCDKLKSLGWKPYWKFKEGLKQTIEEWYIPNQWYLNQ